MITVRQAAFADKPAIFELLRTAYRGRSQYKFPARWEWAFEHNPFCLPNAPPVWIALDGARVVGQSAALVEPLVVDGREVRVGWGIDFFVLPEYRGQGLGTQLQAANNAGNEVFMSLSMAAAAGRIKERLGMQALPPVPVFQKIVYHDPESVLRTLTRRAPGLGALVRAFRLHEFLAARLTTRDARRDAPRLPRAADIALEEVAEFGAAWDDLWTRLAPVYRALVRRDAAYLNWKFVRQPHMQHQRFLARRGDVPVGGLILRRGQPPERSMGVIVDVFAAPDDTAAIRTLLAHAVAVFRAQRVTFISAASSVRGVQDALRAFGFKQTKAATPMARAGFSLPQAGWLLGKGDHDWDQYPLG